MRACPRLVPLATAVALAACEHSPPFSGAREADEGPIPGSDARFITLDTATTVGWSADEAGITILLPRRRPISPPDPPGRTSIPPWQEVSGCAGILPADGGSARWQHCHLFPEFDDRIGVVHGIAVGPGGEVVMVRADRPVGFPFPVGSRINLVRADTSSDARLVVLEPLYRDQLGQLANPPGSANWLTNVRFLDDGRLLAAAWHLRPDATTQFLEWRLGTLSADTITWQPVVAPLDDAAPPVPAGSGRLLWWRGDGTIALARPDGTVLANGAIPLDEGATALAAIQCRPARCLALLRIPAGPDLEWIGVRELALPGLGVTAHERFLASRGAPLFPSTVRGSVISIEQRRLVLHRNVLPVLP